jgi:hypothetical protein
MLCLNMIVRNEMANLERCLDAVADHIDCWMIGDTGSTDGTQDFVKSFYPVPGALHERPDRAIRESRLRPALTEGGHPVRPGFREHRGVPEPYSVAANSVRDLARSLGAATPRVACRSER